MRLLSVSLFALMFVGPAFAAPPPQQGLSETIRKYFGEVVADSQPTDDELVRLLKARFIAAVQAWESQSAALNAGLSNVDSLMTAAGRVRDAWIALCVKPADRLRAFEFYRDMASENELLTEARVKAGKVAVSELDQARYFRLDAEIQLLQAKR